MLSWIHGAFEDSSRAGPPPEAMPADTPAMRELHAWLDAVNSGKADLVRDFVANHFSSKAQKQVPAANRVARLLESHRTHGALTLDRIEQSTDREATALLRCGLTEGWVRITVEVDPDAPQRIERIRIQPADRPKDAPVEARLSDAEIAGRLEKYLEKLVGADVFSGTVVVAHDGKPLFERAYGLASKAYQVPNQLDTKFNLGSMNKMFTAVAIAQLAEAGKLDFSDPLIKHLPDFPNQAAARKITLHHLLTHTSGLGDYFTPKYQETSKDRFRKIADYFPLFADKPLEFEPGAKFRYSNAGFMVLGAVVEKVSGQDYFDYVRAHIYRPAGMANTDAYEMDHDTPNLAIGYTRMGPGAGVRNNLFLHVVKGGPAGGGFSTAEDLVRFDQALRQHKLLAPKFTDVVMAGKIDLPGGDGTRYAYGFEDERFRGQRIVGHGGGFPGINSQLDMYLDSGYTVAVMTNYDPPAAMNVAERLRDWICRD
jgi:CubicO group peptidase (beta-lactamase class C family)